MAITRFEQSLLGFDPYEIRREQIKQLFSSIDQAKTAEGKIGASLGTILGTALFGVPEDPRLQRATEVQQIVKDVVGENTTAEGLSSKLPALKKAFEERNFFDEALVIEERIKKLAPEDPFGKITQSAYTPESIKAFIEGGSKDRTLLVPIQKSQTVGKIGKTERGEQVYQEGDTQYILKDGKRIPFYGSLRYEVPKQPTPAKDYKQLTGLRGDYFKEVGPTFEAFSSLENAKISLGELTGIGDEIAKRQILKASGESGSGLSNKDVQAFSNFGPLGQRISGILSQFLQGTYSEAQRKEVVSLMNQLQGQLQSQADMTREQYRSIGGDLKPADLDFVAPSLSSIYKQVKPQQQPAGGEKPKPTKKEIVLPSGTKARILP